MRKGYVILRFSLIFLSITTSSMSEEYFGKFVGLPVELENIQNSDPKPFKIKKEIRFQDANGLDWVVPAGSYTDGATIPWLFEIIVGDNYDGPYFPASVIHDYYCCIQARMAHDTHRNFYYAMQANDTPPWQAWLMYTAVQLGGPDWTLTQSPAIKDGTECFDELAAVSVPVLNETGVPADQPTSNIFMREYFPSPTFDAFLKAAVAAQTERDTFVVSKLMAVARTLQDTEGKVIDVTTFGQIPATFEGVEQLKTIVDGATSFVGFSTSSERSSFSDFGLLVPIDGSVPEVIAKLKTEGGLTKSETGWSAEELKRIGVAGTAIPERLPETYLVGVARTTNLKGTGIEWAAANSEAERNRWHQIIDADRSYRDWLSNRDILIAPR